MDILAQSANERTVSEVTQATTKAQEIISATVENHLASNTNVILSEAKRLVAAKVSIIPIKPNGSKAPAVSSWKPYQTRLPNESELNEWFKNGNGLATIFGIVSENRELLDFDKPELYQPFCELVEEAMPGLIERLVLVLTPSNGYHLHYRCSKIEGNQKLAQTQLISEDGKKKLYTLIETRGEGGYALIPPSPSACHEDNKPYELLRGDLANAPVITPDEREVLLTCARSFNDYVREENVIKGETSVAGGTRPGDDYNSRFTLADWYDLLTSHGWKKMYQSAGIEYWRRPGKTGPGISATVNYGGDKMLRVFSSNAAPFEEEKVYSPFAAYTFLEHNGDFKAAAKALVKQGYGDNIDSYIREGGKITKLEDKLKSSNSSDSQASQEIAEFPKLDRQKALYGLVGDVVRAIEPHSESDPVALLVQMLAGFGNLIGRSAHFVAEADEHYTNLFVVIVGESSRGRKGSSLGHIKRLLIAVDDEWAGCITSGLSSGEGLIHHVRDEDADGFMPGAVRQSKRAMVIEGEFASVLRAQGRDGNILSAIIRQAWDNGNLNVMRRDRPDRATNAHISIIGHITNYELNRCLRDTDAVNGFANRFLWVSSRRSKKLPEGGDFHKTDVAPLLRRLREAVESARLVRIMNRDEEARELWREIYDKLDEEIPNGRLGATLNRAEAQIGRLACIYALLDCSDVVKRVHLEAAKAVWDYCVASARYIFGENVLSKKAQKFLDALHKAGNKGLNKTQLYTKNGGRPDGVNEALAELKSAGYAFDMKIPTAGRDEERWIAVEASAVQYSEDDDFDEESQNKDELESSKSSISQDKECSTGNSL
jgi:hypothetical protein